MNKSFLIVRLPNLLNNFFQLKEILDSVLSSRCLKTCCQERRIPHTLRYLAEISCNLAKNLEDGKPF